MISKRLKESRLRREISQEKLGVLAGIEEATARSRISHYESARSSPSFKVACNIAKVLHVPVCYFYIESDSFAERVLCSGQ
ncbi:MULTISPECIES: helix-turn-helix transcriptional regulator [Yersinia]|uniref:helix-turn-helix transcriptional regulator n=1 Tax=Yersinia TaxID=629 RepID=UPI00119D2073|nr:helix-turn-helix transcriptional regulator [Yersinia kristensenii]MBW5812597.1 helix-turn-helix transcriptional regulator [Yersinia kristensenii]MBW5818860.1 helix-turn-helix transcriptional regulator [Yersinia kristensenii]MBW5829898.1 helix-turn-helix transcriptional regulator [Yersinia kristensenii]MBW5844484.1 helix-turn-helix transcriptional regulator [Yersinia kristensenii]MDA5490240.1 helix-turn-helix transcriptional regulator [Yersinia kristensenii]